MRRFVRAMTRVLVGVLVVYVLAAAIFGRTQLLALFFGPVEMQETNFAALERPTTPNTFLACPPGVCNGSDMESPIYDVPVDELRDRFFALLLERPALDLLSSDPTHDQYDVRETSLIFAFPDTMTVRLFENRDGTSTVAIYSRSHYGVDDFGVNETRVRWWLQALATEP